MKLPLALFVLVAISSQVALSQTYMATAYPNQNTLMIPDSFKLAVAIKLPPDSYDVSASFNGAHAGGDVDGIFFAAHTGESSTEWPRGHAVYESIHSKAKTISFPNAPDTVLGHLFFEDGGDFNDNAGSATVVFSSKTSGRKYTTTVYPNQNTIMIPDSFNLAVPIKLPPGSYQITASFSSAHAGGDIDGIFFAAHTGENSTQWPRGHAVYESIHSEADTISFVNAPDTVVGHLFFEDGGDFFDNNGNASVEFKKIPITSVEGSENSVPIEFALRQNYPNPFNPSTTINFALPEESIVKLAVYDIVGREVAVLSNERLSEGYYSRTFDGSRLSSGVYFYRLSALAQSGSGHSFSQVRKLILLK
ncbi:MAG TPA: T9SS type A sorting domain-containing protein [Bacteroidota bacterium]|nr:T9SS type A sorting domain-containing protein [Bacteroidota bacterium]